MSLFTKYVENEIAAHPTDRLLGNAARSFLTSLATNAYYEPNEDSLRIWAVEMMLRGINQSTLNRYLSKVHSLCLAYDISFDASFIPELKEQIASDYIVCQDHLLADYAALKKMIIGSKSMDGSEDLYMLLYLLYNPLSQISDLVHLTIDADQPSCPQIVDLIEEIRSSSLRSKYLFGLGQGKKREGQIEREVASRISMLLNRAGIKSLPQSTRSIIQTLWITAALDAGVKLHDIRSLLPSIPPEYKILEALKPKHLTETQTRQIICRVATHINSDVRKWFVMRLRAGHTPESIREKIQSCLPQMLNKMQFYYPSHKVWRKTPKGKRVQKEVPYIPGILFFKMKPDGVKRLMHQIGDTAWCYKINGAADSPYCTISHTQMLEFQRHLGQFTADMQFDLELRERALPEGAEVRISGGGKMEGYTGIIESVNEQNGTRTYTLSLTEVLIARCTVTEIAEHFLEPTTPNQ